MNTQHTTSRPTLRVVSALFPAPWLLLFLGAWCPRAFVDPAEGQDPTSVPQGLDGQDAAAAEPVSESPSQGSAARIPIGMNLSMVTTDNREIVFVDVMKTAGEWQFESSSKPRKGDGGRKKRDGRSREGRQRGEDDSKPKMTFDEFGWPEIPVGQTVAGVLLREMDGLYPSGTYVCTWEGQGQVDFARAGQITERGEQRALVEVDSTKGPITVLFTATDAEDPIRNIRLLMPGFENAESPFYPPLVERLAPFSVIRLHNWGRVFTATGDWSKRTKTTGLSQSGKNGVAVEYMVDLCNEVGAAPWFSMPHTADDEYVRNFATIVHERLDPELPIYVEFSNEVWNSVFSQARWARAQAQERGIRGAEVVADEALRDWRIWYEVFGEDSGRIVRVAAGQLHNPFILRVMLERLGEEVDAIAVASYFGVRPGEGGMGRESSAEELVAAARENLNTVVMKRLADHRELAVRAGERVGKKIALLTYEGGQHIVARKTLGRPDASLAFSPQAVARAQELPAMYEAYEELLNGLEREGVELFMAFKLTGRKTNANTFGLLEDLSEPPESAPKFRALLDYLGVSHSAEKEPPPPPGPQSEERVETGDQEPEKKVE